MLATVDFHNHSCLSPCGSDELTPALLAVEAMEQGINILALTDHNCGKNLTTFKEACQLCSIMPVFGMEVNTIEDTHILALFGNLKDALAFSCFIEALLPPIDNDPLLFGNQLVVDIEGTIVEQYKKSLLTTCGISIEDLVDEVLSRDGLVIPAHIDKEVNSILANLGFLPSLPFSAIELIKPHQHQGEFSYTMTTGSDAHYLEHVGRRSFQLEVPSLDWEGLKEGLRQGTIYYKGQFKQTENTAQ